MKYATPYTTSLKNDQLEYAWVAGERQLTVSLSWPVVEQEQWDILTKQLADMCASDPLIEREGVGINRDYDYLDYYLNQVPHEIPDLEVWFEEQEWIPVSLRDLGLATAVSNIVNRITLCQGIEIYREELQEALHYSGTATDDMGNVVAIDVIPGAYFNSQDDYWGLRFTAQTDDIAQGRLDMCTAEIEVYSVE